jgi:hypothetical protein
MTDYQVTCVDKPNRQSTVEHITHIGNSGGGWKITREDAIRRIESGAESFYTVDPRTGALAYIEVVRPFGRSPHLRTRADGTPSDNLLALADCGASCRLV